MFTAATADFGEDENTLLAEAQRIGQKGDDKDDSTTKASINEPGEGSYERFMLTFGNSRRWAGGM